MKKNNLTFFSVIFFLVIYRTVMAEVTLPVCKGIDSFKWNNCFGTEKKSITYDQLYKDKYKDKKVLYQGEYRNGKLHGQGVITFPDGLKYAGELKYNKPYGQGTMLFPEPAPIFSNDTKYVGEFKYGLPNGYGTITYGNGIKFVGNFRDGSYYGFGTYTFPDGRILRGIWKKSKLIKKNK